MAWLDSSKTACPLFVMVLSTRNQTIVHHVLLELRDFGIENFQILSMLFSYLHFAFPRSLGHEDAVTSAAVSVAAQKVTFSAFACLLRLFESSFAVEQRFRIAAESAKV